ncbi:MAG: 30S ribosomal protein S6--L-glutamate ligase [Thermodesulfobacteriota bacterium]
MKIVILSRNPNLYSTNRLFEVATQKGHDVEIIDFLKCYIVMAKGKPDIFLDGQKLEKYDAVIPRIGASRTFYGCAVVRQFEMMNTFCLNSSLAISRSRDKLRSLQILSRSDLEIPYTAFAANPTDIPHLIKEVGGAPLVVKLLQGTQGIGVVLTETVKASKSVIEAFYGIKANMLIQEFIEESKGADIRALVVGNTVVASIKRQGEEGEFRSNLHRGGSAINFKLTKEERNTAVQAAKLLGLNVAGVDMLMSEKGPMVIEVNSSPGLEGIETSTGKDIAGKIIEYIEKSVTSKRKRRIAS